MTSRLTTLRDVPIGNKVLVFTERLTNNKLVVIARKSDLPMVEATIIGKDGKQHTCIGWKSALDGFILYPKLKFLPQDELINNHNDYRHYQWLHNSALCHVEVVYDTTCSVCNSAAPHIKKTKYTCKICETILIHELNNA